MSAESIIVQIDSTQVAAQKQNNYSLYLAKMVNGVCNVIWQSQGPEPTAANPSTYEVNNTFDITISNYMVDYATALSTQGSVTDQASGIPVKIYTGQIVTLYENGLFGSPIPNIYTPNPSESIVIVNEMQGNPHTLLLDDAGNPIFANSSGMDVGDEELTPIDTYQIWFGNYQDTGSIIALDMSSIGTVAFGLNSPTTQTISYTADGAWVPGGLSSTYDLAERTGPEGRFITVEVSVTFKHALSLAAAAFLLSKFIDKFSSGLRPSSVTTSAGSFNLAVKFDGPKNRDILKVFGASKFDEVVLGALSAVKNEKNSVLAGKTWALGNTAITVSH